ncbi:MAG: peptidoglycan synthetase [Bacteroidetes bacterium]|nr:peptidoglycan synthetase [Bacteroidota bacterium]
MTRSFHFIAIGGAVMHQLAIYLLQQGHSVSGSDDTIFDPALGQLRDSGILPEQFGWFPQKIHNKLDCVILGMHAKKDNPELLKAQQIGLKIYSFPAFIYEQSRSKKRVAIAGSHGKTTITAMIMHILSKTNIDFDYLVGSRIEGFETMVKISESAEVIILEADEYLSSAIDLRSKFLHYHPHIAVISGIAWDHVNVFPSFEGYLETFRNFIQSIHADGKLIYYNTDKHLPELVKSAEADLIPYTGFENLERSGKTYVSFEGNEYPVEIFGKHNMENLKSAVLVANQLGIPSHEALNSMESFSGSAKRLELVYTDESNSLFVYRDFAHAPSKLKASMSALRQKYNQHHITGVFELHTYSSLQPDFLEGYEGSMKDADVRIVFLDEHALKIKGREDIPDEVIERCFNDEIRVVRSSEILAGILSRGPSNKAVIALMSSGNFGGFNMNSLRE